jgi:hypothetical protein
MISGDETTAHSKPRTIPRSNIKPLKNLLSATNSLHNCTISRHVFKIRSGEGSQVRVLGFKMSFPWSMMSAVRPLT